MVDQVLRPVLAQSRCSIKLFFFFFLNEYRQILIDAMTVPTKELPRLADLWAPTETCDGG